ncbi:MAG TPA: deoxyribose-phosphate aldolase [Candidatus Blackburnbacteria bacterium]|nr:deoxyribose-phosphate aldolase [Candidatus Blackburnbacteria bacterium]
METTTTRRKVLLEYNMENVTHYLDFANHHQDATIGQIKELCQKVVEYGFHAAFVNPCYVKLAREELGPIGVVGTAVSFPLGQDTKDTKIASCVEAVQDGADELDLCMNVGLFKSGKEDEVLVEMKEIVSRVKELSSKAIVKFIIETELLTTEQIKKASELVVESGADFVKTNSGMGKRGPTVDEVELINKVVGGRAKIKVAGGIDTYEKAIALIRAGADRIGTSHAIEIISGNDNEIEPG